MGKKENLDINYLNKFDKARTESVEEADFNREMEDIAAKDVDSLIREGRAFWKEKRDNKGGQELEEITVTLPDGKVLFYANEKELKKFSEDAIDKIKVKFSPNAEERANFYDGEPITFAAMAKIKKAIRSGGIVEDKKYGKDGETIEESTIKLVSGEIVSYMNIKEIERLSKEDAERKAVARKMAQEKRSGKLLSDNN